MFERFEGAKREKRGKSRVLTFGASIAAHAGLVATLLFWSFWRIERVQAKTVPVVFQVAMAPPAPPPPAAAPPAPAPAVMKRVVNEVVQPTPKVEPDEPPVTSTSTTSEPTTSTPSANGVPGGSGEPTGTGTPDAGVPPIIDKVMPVTAIEAQRIAGNRDIALPSDVKVTMVAEGKTEVRAMVKLCLDESGVPNRVQVVGSTGYPAADEKIRDEVSEWRYRPYLVNGGAVRVCTAVSFKYQLQ